MSNFFEIILYPIASGICGSLAGFFGKLAFQNDEIVELPQAFSEFYLYYLIRLGLFIIMLNFNKMMFQFLFVSWDKSGSFVTTCLNFVTNNLLNALIGLVYFKEALSLKWIIGSLCIVSGVGIIARKSPKKDKKE